MALENKKMIFSLIRVCCTFLIYSNEKEGLSGLAPCGFALKKKERSSYCSVLFVSLA